MDRKEKEKKALEIVRTVANVIRELREIPSGHLYARLMEVLTLDEYNQIIGLLKRAGLVTETYYNLKWKGPENGKI